VNPEEIRYTVHAGARVAVRDIPQSAVNAAIASGAVEVETGGVRRYTLEGLIVVVDGCDVVTAFYDSDLRRRGAWGPKKKQRRCRRGEMKPHYFEGRGHINVRRQAYYQQQAEVMI
jgi:hypothetical protein